MALVEPAAAEVVELRALWFAAELRAFDAQRDLELLQQVIRLVVEDAADPSTDELRCWRFPTVTPVQNEAVKRALAVGR